MISREGEDEKQFSPIIYFSSARENAVMLDIRRGKISELKNEEGEKKKPWGSVVEIFVWKM